MIFTGIHVPAQNPFIRHYSTLDGLPSNTINWIELDRDNFIWISTEGGLVKYDGSTFTNYGMEDGLSHNEVVNVKTDKQGRVWLFCLNGKRDFYYHNKIFNEKNTPFLKELRSTFYFVQDQYNNLYFFSFHARRISVLDTSNTLKHYFLPSVPQENSPVSRDGMNIQYLTRLPSDEFLIWTYIGLYKTSDLSKEPKLVVSFDRYHNIYPLGDTIMYDVIADKLTNTSMLIRYSNGIPGDTTLFTEDALDNDGTIVEEPNGNLWISSYTKGLFCLKNKKIIYHSDIKEVQCILRDHEGNIWIDAKKGVYKISPYILDFKHFDNTNFQNEGIDALSQNPDGGIWCIENQKIYLYKNGEFFSYDINQPDRVFKNIYGLQNNTLIFGEYFYDWNVMSGISTDPGTMKITYKKVFRLPANGHLSVDKTRSEISLNDFRKYELTRFSSLNQFQEISRKPIGVARNAFYISNNILAVFKINGIFMNQDDSLVPYDSFNSLPRIRFKEHINLENFADLFLSIADSLYLVKQKKVLNLTTSFVISMNTPIQHIQYEKQRLYLSTFRNIFICENPFNIDNNSFPLRLLDINFIDIRGILVYNDTLYVASGDGLTVLPTSSIEKIRACIPDPYFKAVLINDSATDLFGPEITIKGRNKINISFSSINYSHNPVLYSYKLDGYDEEWTTGTTRSVVYSNLSPGKYIFKVRAGKSNSPWSEPIEYHFTVKAALWNHPLFYAFLAILIAGVIILFVIRRKNLQLKRREMDHQIVTLEQKALQSMMNPHFIFNSLGSIQNYLLQKKTSEAGLYLSQFARLIRQNLNAINAAMINLDEETDRLKNYLDLEKMRLPDRFDYSIEIDEAIESDETFIPSMIVQPFIENSIWHGISPLEEKGLVKVLIQKESEYALKIIVEDNGIGMKKSAVYSLKKKEEHLRLSLEMTLKRLHLLGLKFNVATRIDFSEAFPGNENPGTKVVIVLPFKYNANAD